MKNKVVTNASWIIAGKIAQSVLGLIVSMLTARYLGPSAFGIINYATSIVAFVIPIMQLGINNILVQEFINRPNEEGKILGTSLLLNLISSFACIIGVITFTFVVNFNDNVTILVCSLYSIQLIFQTMELCIYWFQSKYLSKYTSIVSLIAYTIVSIYKIFLLVTHKSIYWFAVSNALDYMLIGFLSLILYKLLGGQHLSFSLDMAKRLFCKSHYYIVSSIMVTIFAQTDKIMINQMMDSTSTGYYSAAVTCAGLTSFVFAAIIDSFRPSIFESKIENEEKYILNMTRLYSIVIYLSLFQSIVTALFSSVIVKILYGNQYLPSVNVLRIIVWYTTFSYIGAVRNVWILAENNQKYLWKINLSGAVLNIILNAILIPKLGISGAAIASLLTQIFTNVIIGYIFSDLRENNRIMMQSLKPKYICEIIKYIMHK